MRSSVHLLAAAVAALLLLAACTEADTDPSDANDVGDVDTGDTDVASPIDDDATAATVDGEEIPAVLVEERVDRMEQAGLGTEMEADPAELREMLRAEVLSGEILRLIVLNGAAELGVEVGDEDIEQTWEDAAVQAGGPEELEQAIAGTGLSEEDLASEFETQTALRLVVQQLAPDAEWEGGPSEEAQAVVQEWLGEQLAAATVSVNAAYGSWNPEMGRVVPAAMEIPAGPPEGMPEDVPEAPES